MKTNIIALHRDCLREHGRVARRKWSIASPVRSMLVTLATALPAAAIMVLTVLAFGSQAPGFAAAGLWATGFIFLALGVENEGARPLLLGISGAVLMLLAWLGFSFSPEFGVLAGFIVAGWVAFAIGSHLVRPESGPDSNNEFAGNI
jgi:hypothetical protein